MYLPVHRALPAPVLQARGAAAHAVHVPTAHVHVRAPVPVRAQEAEERDVLRRTFIIPTLS